MKDYGVSVLSQYEMEIYGTHRIRGAILCDTDKGLFLLKETRIEENRACALAKIYEQLSENGFDRVDSPVLNKEDAYISKAEDGTGYIVKKWFPGRECDVRHENELIEGAKLLAVIHCCMQDKSEKPEIKKCLTSTDPILEEYKKHNRELRKVWEFVRRRSVKKPFEIAFLKGYDQMYFWAEAVFQTAETMDFSILFEKALREAHMVHGDYNYHNLLVGPEKMAVTGFEHAHCAVQLEDLYYFLRKCLEKHHYDERLGACMLKSYEAVKSLDKKEMDYLAIRLAYPEKFWKIANSYYHSGKAWIPAKNVEKLLISVAQNEEKKHFLENIFSFRI